MRKIDPLLFVLAATFGVAVNLDFAKNHLHVIPHIVLCAVLFLGALAYVYYRFSPAQFCDRSWPAKQRAINIVLFVALNVVEWSAVALTRNLS